MSLPHRVPRTKPAPWSTPAGIGAVVDHWLESNYVKPCFLADETLSGSEASTVAFPEALGDGLIGALRARGIERLYSHQGRAFEVAQSGTNFVVATPTASGKSFCFHLPVLKALLDEPDARAIYLYPTKALARDQENGLRELMAAAGLNAVASGGRPPASAVVFDGDTPGDARRAARERAGIVITNPDMLHAGILPHHASWARTFQHLRYVIVDELHTYKGVFGSHVANVLRRLLRVARFHGSNPVLIGATATIGNPREHATRLFGLGECENEIDGISSRDLELIATSGAPRGARRFFLFNPPVVNAELGIRASYVKQAVMLAADLVRAKVPTIVFGQSRNNVEVMLRYLRDRVAPEIDASRIMGYRGGYLPAQRREIERKLRAGEVLAVVATNALELGIDIGELDAVICAGYPGSTAAMWQRFGRAGRRGETSICVLVTSSAPIDQYLAREPGFLLGSPIEEARIDPDNVEILIQHLKCAAFEMPFRRGESFGSLGPKETADALGFLVQHRVLHEAGGTFHWAEDAYPASNVSLRSIGWDNVVIIDAATDTSFAEMDWRGSHTMLHEQAIYQHDGECWQVERLDYENHKAFVRKVAPDYYTDAMTYAQVSVIEKSDEGSLVESSAAGSATSDAFTADHGGWLAGWGEVSLVEKVVGYKKIKFFTHENAGFGDVHLPEMQMHTTAFWLTVPEWRCAQIESGRAAAIDGLRGIGVALETVATLALMADPRDLGTTLGDAVAESDANVNGPEERNSAPPPMLPRKAPGGPKPGYSPTLFVYEHTPGGIGLAERIFEQREILVARALRLIEKCPCSAGCPACVGPSDAIAMMGSEMNVDRSRKAVALELLRSVIPTA
jgi:DEAD/DEAH box helicase domain-containing protein